MGYEPLTTDTAIGISIASFLYRSTSALTVGYVWSSFPPNLGTAGINCDPNFIIVIDTRRGKWNDQVHAWCMRNRHHRLGLLETLDPEFPVASPSYRLVEIVSKLAQLATINGGV